MKENYKKGRILTFNSKKRMHQYLKDDTFIRSMFILGISCIDLACSSIETPYPVGIKLPWRAPDEVHDLTKQLESREINDSVSDEKSEPNTTYFGNVKTFRPVLKSGSTQTSFNKEPGTDIQFRDADIHSVIDAILGDALKLNYTIDPSIQGKITLHTRGPLSKSALLPVLESALLSVSAAIVQQGGIYHVMPLDLAPQRIRGGNRLTPNSVTTPGFGIDILPLRYIKAQEIQKILNSVFPRGTVLQADETYNHLVISGTSEDRMAVQRMVESFDVDWLQGMNFALYRVEHSDPTQLITELKEIFQSPIDVVGSRVRFVALNRMQAILGISKDHSDLEVIDSWVKRLDISKTDEQRVFVYNVQNGNAKELVAALRQLFGGGGSASTKDGDSGQSEKTYVAESGTQSTPMQMDSPTKLDGYEKTFMPAGGYPPNQSSNHSSKLVASEETNSLLYYGTEKGFQVIKDAVMQLDIIPRQVMIEAILAEVTLNDDLRYGVQWFFDSKQNSVELSAAETGISSLFPGFSYVYSGGSDVKIILNALQSKTDVRVISAPKLSVLNNQKANLQVGDQVPILTQTSQSTSAPGAPIVSSIQMRDTGVILDIKPRINENGSLLLDVTQEVSDVAKTTTSGINSPTIQKRKIQTSVLTNDGYTVALGGLIRDNSSEINSGVPIIKDIPIFGNLFKDNSSGDKRTELIVLLVPHIMRNQAETQSVVDSMVSEMNSASQIIDRELPVAPNSKQ
ncbi:type II secretion system secretin GspD [Methylomonas sp. UP202]|uniref:type II secretion system secretin GspD n=1 Tax=Methylomonas sp. UP202 TaxID=3040943 RepID=UPI00247AD01D|nr:type II secretion system secretin GspD [Methylomonas sp. UP202]WGS88642.1 type II secretion system secretin GspD [Methylomonas sp. UP202]